MDKNLSSLFAAVEAGDGSSAESLFAVLYAELHAIARRELSRGGPVATLRATSLLHQAYIDISQREAAFPDRNRFMAYAARVMRGLIIDGVRNRRAQKRGGLFELTSLTTDVVERSPPADTDKLQEISDALDALAAVDAPLAEVVDLKFFCGFSFAEIAAMQEVSERTVQRNWHKARVFLYRTIQDAQLHA
jgi:RNA polymerase sigma factor (TIGR02999 family)